MPVPESRQSRAPGYYFLAGFYSLGVGVVDMDDAVDLFFLETFPLMY